jgi:phosphoribosylformimino-5-aminoimidazole carboxamide ribotide isomerase
MLVIPVIDIKNGKVVRQIQGLSDKTEYYSETPLKMARLFRKENFKALHITDLDGALHGEIRNYNIIKEICETLDIPIQLGGGIRDYKTAEKMIRELGVFRIVIGTKALEDPELIKQLIKDFSTSKIVIGIDEKLNNVVKNGWVNYANITPLEFAISMESIGVTRIIYQDVTRVGNLSGPYVYRLVEIAKNTKLKITSAGGISDYRDLLMLANLNIPNIDSVLVSRAIYENKFPCQEIWRNAERDDTTLDLSKA